MAGKKRKNGRNSNGCGGTIRRSDGRWQSQFTFHYADGTVKRLYRYTKTKHEGEEWRDLMAEKEKEEQQKPPTIKTILEWLYEWLRMFCINVRQSTRDSYETNIRRIGQSKLANVPLHELTTSMLQEYILYLLEHGRLDGKGGLSAKSVKNLFSMLHESLKQAVGCKLINSNPADYVQLPKVKSKPINILTSDEMKRLLDACRGERWYASMVILMWTGIRAGENLGLQRSHFKCENGLYYLTIRQSVTRSGNPDYDAAATSGIQSKKTICQVSPCKTDNAYRDIPLLPEVAEVLLEKFRQQDELAAQMPDVYMEDPFITDSWNGSFVDPANFRRWFNRMVDRAGIEKRCYQHLLRHGFGSMAVQNHIDQKHIADLLGHYSTEFSSRVYQHTSIESKATAMTNLEELATEMLKTR